MLKNAIGLRPEFEYLNQAAQQVVNSGADPAEVQAFLAELAPLYEITAPKLAKQPLIVAPSAKGRLAAAAAPKKKTKISLPRATKLKWWQDAMIGTALMAWPPLGITVNASRGLAAAFKVTIGLGPQISAGLAAGGSLGCGLCLTVDGSLGFYGSLGPMVGWIYSVSGVVQVTIIAGGIDRFQGWAFGVGADGGEVIVGNAAALLDTNMKFLGITAGIGAGAGIPFELFVSAQRTWTTK